MRGKPGTGHGGYQLLAFRPILSSDGEKLNLTLRVIAHSGDFAFPSLLMAAHILLFLAEQRWIIQALSLDISVETKSGDYQRETAEKE